MRQGHDPMVHGILMYIVKPGEVRFLERQFAVPKLINDLPARSRVQLIKLESQFAVQVAQEDPMRHGGFLEVHQKMVMVGQKCPSVKAQVVIRSQAESSGAE